MAKTSRRKTSRKTTIYDLAALSGASPSTVSAALSGSWQQRRIKESTALAIQDLARDHHYRTNMQARGLRSSRSGLIGLILPLHENRFFSSLSQCFDVHARSKGLCPVVVSTGRDPREERQTVETLLSYAVDALFIAGATDPDALSPICKAAGIPHVNIDLPGSLAPSVTSDNRGGSMRLTQALLDWHAPSQDSAIDREEGSGTSTAPYFLGGLKEDFATRGRIGGFREIVQSRFGTVDSSRILTTGYSPKSAAAEMRRLCDQLGGPPKRLFVNSISVLEGVLHHLKMVEQKTLRDIVVGCYDYNPFGSFLPFPVIMMRQNVEQMVSVAFSMMDGEGPDEWLVEIDPELVPPHTAMEGHLGRFG